MKKKERRRDEPEPPRNGAAIPIVGIGASAGGLGALETLVPLLEPGAGLAYVVVQHLDPDRKSVLAALLARTAKIPVIEIADQATIETDHVYVIPPNAALAIFDNRLQISAPLEQRFQRTPIDGFFISLAEANGEGSAGVILSGTGSDGTLGLRAIKEQGGLTVAQDGAEYDGMMRSAVRSGMVDFVLALEKIPAKLNDYFRHLNSVDGRKGPDGVRPEAADHLAQVSALLRTRTGHDFSGYKDKTVARRVQRRMQVLQIDEVPDFIERLRKEPRELDALLQDLLIGVTNFFRDPQAFEALERQVIPRLFEGKGPDDTIRIWVPGCSTGEEAYSIAILLREHMPKAQSAPKLQIFASDIDEQSLQIARAGRFPSAIAKDIPPARLERYFMREDGTYRIASELREICLFSSHNLLRDAPFSKLDLIACRNLLIYLMPELQNRLIPLLHYALNDGGFLFLGTSENVTRHSRLFNTIDKQHRLFSRRPQTERRLPEFPLTTPEGGHRQLAATPRNAAEQEPLQSLAERQLLERYSPAYVVINGDGELLHGSARTGKYLELAPGAPRIDIYSMARPGLRPDLRAAVHKAAGTGQVAIQRNVAVGTNGGRQAIDLIVHPIRSAAIRDSIYMVIFQDVGGISAASDAEIAESADELESASLRQLEIDLRATRERLQTTTEELESSNEELKSGNEELSSMNEELQSTNEELETSKEELQSINEELQTVNAELNARVEELSRANSDIANLLESTQIATVFLDRNLAVKNFTPAAKDLFRLVESDTGRPITHVRARFQSDTVQDDAERVLRTLATIEREVESNYNDARYIMRMMPYRSVDNVIGGVVITFVDVTRITAAETRIGELTADLRNRVQSLETLLNLLPVGILIVEDDRADPVRVNRYGARVAGRERRWRRRRRTSAGADGAARLPGRPRASAGRAAAAPGSAFRAGGAGLRGPRPARRRQSRRGHDVGDADARRPRQGAGRHRGHPRHHRTAHRRGPSADPALRAAAPGQEHHHHHRRAGQPHDEGQHVARRLFRRLPRPPAGHGGDARAAVARQLDRCGPARAGRGGPAVAPRQGRRDGDAERTRPHSHAERGLHPRSGVLRAGHQCHQVRQPVGRWAGWRPVAGRAGRCRGDRRDRMDRDRRPASEGADRGGLRHRLRQAQHRIRAERYSHRAT